MRPLPGLLVLLIASASTVFAADVPPVYPIHMIQGSGATSPYAGVSVNLIGIVTSLKSNGFFVQEADKSADSDPTTSEGIFVFTSSAPTVSVGDWVNVHGTVQEYVPSADKASAPMTEITSPSVQISNTGQTLPAPIVLTPADSGNLERFEGMRVTATLDVVGPTGGSVDEKNANSTSNGVFYGVIHGVPRPFREPGINVSDSVPSPNPPNVPRFDENFERIRVDSDAAGSTPPRSAIDVSVGQTVTLTGPVDFAYRVFNILPDPGAQQSSSGPIAAREASSPASNEFTVATANLERFFNDVDDADLAAGNEPVLTASAFSSRLAKAQAIIAAYLHLPDILVLEEVENLATLSSLANKLNELDSKPNHYVPYLIEGNDVGGIDIGILTRTAPVKGGLPRVEVVSVTQMNKDETYVDPTSGRSATLNDRPPLVLRAVIHFDSGQAFPVTVIGNHLRSLNDVETDARVRAKRAAQAESLALLVQQLQSAGERVIVAGDFNAFQFNDGYVDVMGTIGGTPAPADQVVVPTRDLVDPDLSNLDDLLPAAERYSYVFDGNAQALDHILVSNSLKAAVGTIRFDHARLNADVAEVYRDANSLCSGICILSPLRLSDHDPAIAYFALPSPQPARRRAAR